MSILEKDAKRKDEHRPPPLTVRRARRRAVRRRGRLERGRWWQVLGRLFREASLEWWNSQAMRYGASLAFYTFFSLTPLLMIAISIAGLIFGRDAAQGRVIAEIGSLLGPANALTIQEALESARQPVPSSLTALIGLAALLFGAMGVFVELQDSLNRIWDLPTHRSTLLSFVRSRVLSFAMILGLGFLLLVSLLLSAGVAAAGGAILELLPGTRVLIETSHWVVSVTMATLLFAMIYKVLPDIRLAWRDVWMGALVTGLLFSAGKWFIGAYLGSGVVGTAYGGASAVVLILLWTYYSALILFFGAEFTRVYSQHFGSLSAPPASPARLRHL